MRKSEFTNNTVENFLKKKRNFEKNFKIVFIREFGAFLEKRPKRKVK